MYKWTKAPTWLTPFMNKDLVVAKWDMPGQILPLMEILDLTKKTHCYGWAYEPKGE